MGESFREKRAALSGSCTLSSADGATALAVTSKPGNFSSGLGFGGRVGGATPFFGQQWMELESKVCTSFFAPSIP